MLLTNGKRQEILDAGSVKNIEQDAIIANVKDSTFKSLEATYITLNYYEPDEVTYTLNLAIFLNSENGIYDFSTSAGRKATLIVPAKKILVSRPIFDFELYFTPDENWEGIFYGDEKIADSMIVPGDGNGYVFV